MKRDYSGLFPISEDSIIAFRFTSKGFSPVIMENKVVDNVAAIKFLGQEIVDADPIVKSWIAPPPSTINIDSLTISSGSYNALCTYRFCFTISDCRRI